MPLRASQLRPAPRQEVARLHTHPRRLAQSPQTSLAPLFLIEKNMAQARGNRNRIQQNFSTTHQQTSGKVKRREHKENGKKSQSQRKPNPRRQKQSAPHPHGEHLFQRLATLPAHRPHWIRNHGSKDRRQRNQQIIPQEMRLHRRAKAMHRPDNEKLPGSKHHTPGHQRKQAKSGRPRSRPANRIGSQPHSIGQHPARQAKRMRSSRRRVVRQMPKLRLPLARPLLAAQQRNNPKGSAMRAPQQHFRKSSRSQSYRAPFCGIRRASIGYRLAAACKASRPARVSV